MICRKICCCIRCHERNNSLTTMNGASLYSLLWLACKPPAVALHEAASLSGIHVWTGHNCCLCCQEKGWPGVPIFSICPFLLLKTTKMENNRRVIPTSPCDLDKGVSLALRLQKLLPDLSRGANASSFLAQPFLLKYFLWFDLVGWSVEALFCPNQSQHRASGTAVWHQKLFINLTDALCTSSQCYVRWFKQLFWSNSIYLCLGASWFLTYESH